MSSQGPWALEMDNHLLAMELSSGHHHGSRRLGRRHHLGTWNSPSRFACFPGGWGGPGPNVPKFGRKNDEAQQGGLPFLSSGDRWGPQADVFDHPRRSLLPSTVPTSCLSPRPRVIRPLGVKGQ